MSELLKAFYLAYVAWVDAGAIENEPFTREAGLCWNTEPYSISSGRTIESQRQLEEELEDQFEDQFEAAGMNHTFPFNNNHTKYIEECDNLTCHLNPKRIAWVRNQVEKIKAES